MYKYYKSFKNALLIYLMKKIKKCDQNNSFIK